MIKGMRACQKAIRPCVQALSCATLVAMLPAVPAQAETRMVQGRAVPGSDWVVIRDAIEVTRYLQGTLLCRSFSDREVELGRTGGGNMRLWPNTRMVRTYKQTFALTNYPGAENLKPGHIIKGVAAVPVGSFGSDRATLYDYGTVYVPPTRKATPAEAAAAKAEAGKKLSESDAAKLKFEEEQAEKGKDRYQYKVGMRYLKGDGVPADEIKALDYLYKAAAQGNEEARKALAKVNTEAEANGSPTR